MHTRPGFIFIKKLARKTNVDEDPLYAVLKQYLNFCCYFEFMICVYKQIYSNDSNQTIMCRI